VTTVPACKNAQACGASLQAACLSDSRAHYHPPRGAAHLLTFTSRLSSTVGLPMPLPLLLPPPPAATGSMALATYTASDTWRTYRSLVYSPAQASVQPLVYSSRCLGRISNGRAQYWTGRR